MPADPNPAGAYNFAVGALAATALVASTLV